MGAPAQRRAVAAHPDAGDRCHHHPTAPTESHSEKNRANCWADWRKLRGGAAATTEIWGRFAHSEVGAECSKRHECAVDRRETA
jgi:hypothetical protein